MELKFHSLNARRFWFHASTKLKGEGYLVKIAHAFRNLPPSRGRRFLKELLALVPQPQGYDTHLILVLKSIKILTQWAKPKGLALRIMLNV